MKTDFNRAGAIFCSYVVEKITNCGAGAAEDEDCIYISPDRPRDRFFIGRLSPAGIASVSEELLDNSEDFLARLNPFSMKIRFLLRGKKDTRISVHPSFHIYSRVFPIYSRQLKEAELLISKSNHIELMPAFRRVTPSITPVEFPLSAIISERKEYPVSWDQGVFSNLQDIYKGDSNHRITMVDLDNEEAYLNCLRNIPGDPLIPDINVSLLVSSEKVGDQDDLWEISVALVNRSIDSDPAGKKRLYDEVIFNVRFKTILEEGFIEPYEFPALPKSYRFDRKMYGTGINCSVIIDEKESVHPTSLTTHAVPIYAQKRFDHRDFDDIDISFQALTTNNPEIILDKIIREMNIFDKTEWEDKNRDLKNNKDVEQELLEFQQDRDSFRKEILRFESGIKCLKNPQAAEAFRLMNATFQLIGKEQNHSNWRLFQIVFIVSLLPSIVGREFPEYVDSDEWETTDVIWFPTGGGKTEAYLGLTVFALFFDRIRNRDRGVTAIYRFPLRLLSLQQFQRIVKTIAAANLIKSDEGINGEKFTVGHWIGSGGSPNQIKKEEAEEYVKNPALIQKYKKLSECPNPGCGNRNIEMYFEKSTMSLQHICPRCGILPVLIVDHELYRLLPSVVVGTVDKMAVFGQQRRFANLMGWTKGYCSDHGYAPEDTCEICQRKNLPGKPFKDPVPSLHVQDELHLLKEDLGAFDSHYETSVIEMQKVIPGSMHPWKTIAATATIEEYNRHIKHLYLHKGRRFPTSGPTYTKTFFAKTDPSRISRLFAGIIPSGLTHINAMVMILWYFHREITHLRKLTPNQFLDITKINNELKEEEVSSFLDQYEICLNYVLTKKAGDQMAESIDAQIGNYLRDQGYPEILSEVLSGGTSSEKITEVMNRIEKYDLDEEDTWKRIRSIVATSMISHGVDVERFNFISFFGMPRMTSEYIQASSRVGRAFPGIVLVCFAPARERDRSHYHLFRKYHEYLERLVESAAINRWSRFSIEKTMAGIILGYISHELSRETGKKLTTPKSVKELIPEFLTEEKIRTRINQYYGADLQHTKVFKNIITDEVARFLNGLPNSNSWIGRLRGWRPMRSLRDTDREISFWPAKAAAPLFELLQKNRLSGGELENVVDINGEDE